MLWEDPQGRAARSVDWQARLAPLLTMPSDEAGLRAFIRAFEVCFDTAPLLLPQAGQRVPAGLELALYARPRRGLGTDPSSPESMGVRQGLIDLVQQAWPTWATARDLVIRAHPERARLLLRPENGWVPELGVRLELQQRTLTFGAPDAAQRACLREIEGRLLALGARRRSWRTR